MARRSAKKDSRRLMRIGNKLRKGSKRIAILMISALIVFGLIYLFSDPLIGVFLLICGVTGAVGVAVLAARNQAE